MSAELTGTAVLAGVGDPAANRVVYGTVIALVVIGIALVVLAVWLIRQTRADPELLAPLERMSDRSWKRKDPATQRRMLDEVRPDGAVPLHREPSAPEVVEEFDKPAPIVASFDDLKDPGPEEGAELPAPQPDSESAAEGQDAEATADGAEPVEDAEAADAEPEPVESEAATSSDDVELSEPPSPELTDDTSSSEYADESSDPAEDVPAVGADLPDPEPGGDARANQPSGRSEPVEEAESMVESGPGAGADPGPGADGAAVPSVDDASVAAAAPVEVASVVDDGGSPRESGGDEH